jgi:hypothetical protein
VTPALGGRGETKRPPRCVAFSFVKRCSRSLARLQESRPAPHARRLHRRRCTLARPSARPSSDADVAFVYEPPLTLFTFSLSASRSGRRKPAVLVSLPPLPPPRLAFPVRPTAPALLPFPGVFVSADAAWLRVFSLLPVQALAAAACVSRRFRWLSRRVLHATVEATLVLRASKPSPESAVAGVLRSAPALRMLVLVSTSGAPLTDAICARVARAAPTQLASVCLSVATGGANLVTGAGLVALAAAPGVTALQVDGAAAVTSLTLQAPRLRRFALRGAAHLGGVTLDCPALEALDLDLSAADEPLSVLRSAERAVRSLDAASLARDALAGCPSLSSLSLLIPGCGCGDAVASVIAAAPCAASLRALALPRAGPTLTDTGVAAVVSTCNALQSFELSGAPTITGATLQSIAASPFADKFVNLALRGCSGLTRDAVSLALPSLPSLRTLDIAHSLIAPPAAVAPPRKRAAVLPAAAPGAGPAGRLVLSSLSLRCVSLSGCISVSSLRLDCAALRALGLCGSAVQDVEFVGLHPQLSVLDGVGTQSCMCRGLREAAACAMHASGLEALAKIWAESVTL